MREWGSQDTADILAVHYVCCTSTVAILCSCGQEKSDSLMWREEREEKLRERQSSRNRHTVPQYVYCVSSIFFRLPTLRSTFK